MEVPKAWQRRAFVDFGQASPGQHVGPGLEGGWDGGLAADCAGAGFGAIRAGGFLPLEAAGGCKTVAGAYYS